MTSKVKLTKRQIKEDKFTTFMLNAKSKVTENWQFYMIGVIAVVLLVVGVVYIINSGEQRSQDASAKFGEAMAAYRAQQNQVAIVALNEIVEDYGSEDVAPMATFLLGRVNYELRNYEEATRFYEMYLSKYKHDKLDRAASQAGLAACAENQGNFELARQKYAAAYEEYPDGPLAGNYELSALRMAIKTGDLEGARERLASIEKNQKGTETLNTAMRLVNEAEKP